MMGNSERGSEMDYQTLYNAIQTLYSNSSVSSNEKHAASAYLEEVQKSVHAWSLADQLLYHGPDLNTRYFGAQTLRTKIQSYFDELPSESHVSLRDSLLQHIKNLTPATENSVVNQLCLAVAQMVLQSVSWADPFGHLLNLFGSDPVHWWPLLEIFSFIPEELHSRKLHLGDNRRKQIKNNLKDVAPLILNFIKQCLEAGKNGSLASVGAPVEQISVGVLNCYKSWIFMNPEVYCNDRPSQILDFAVTQLQLGRCGMRMHCVAMDCICSLIELLPEMESNSRTNNNLAAELNLAQQELFTAIMSFENAYQLSVAHEDHEKTQNYCRIFSDYGETMIDYMVKSWRNPHYSLRSLDLILMCSGHHEYEVIEMTFGFWYKLSEVLYHAHDESLNSMFRPYVSRFFHSLYFHCSLDEDHEGPLEHTDEFYDFRKRGSELIEDLVFIVGAELAFSDLGSQLLLPGSRWPTQEAALFLLHTVSKSLDLDRNESVEPVLGALLNWGEWSHVMLHMSAVKFIGSISLWFSHHPEEYLVKALTFLASSIGTPQVSPVAGHALLNMCQICKNEIAPKHLSSLISLLSQMDVHNVDNDAIIGLLRGVGYVVATLPNNEYSSTVRQICFAQLKPLNELTQTVSVEYERGGKSDPAYWLDRLAALFRSAGGSVVPPLPPPTDKETHPCVVAICEDTWPVLSRICDKYQADSRVMERVCRCLRYAIRALGKHSHPLLPTLVSQLVSMYQVHHHSCFLYVGSILVDEYGNESSCTDGLIKMLEAFFEPTFKILSAPDGLKNNPDTVEDFFRLCQRYIERCPVVFLKSGILLSILQLACLGFRLDHREANNRIFEFLYEFVHQARRDRENCSDLEEMRVLVRTVLLTYGSQLVSESCSAATFDLPTPLITNIAGFYYEIKEFMPVEFSAWFELALKGLKNISKAGAPYATFEQLGNTHKQITSSSGPKEMTRHFKEFVRLYR